MTTSPKAVIDHAEHSAFSDPGAFTHLLAELSPDPQSISDVACNLIVHYRASGHQLPPTSRDDINARWLERTLTLDQARHPVPLSDPRELTERVQGCCRDHTLFSVGVLRSHRIPARSRVGYAGYFIPGWHADHVIVEAWIDGRWRRFDPELSEPNANVAMPMDMPMVDPGSPGFVTAAQVWAAHRRGDVDAEVYGVGPDVPGFRGERFIFDEVIYEIAHRFGDELLLWDGWGRIGEPDEPVSSSDADWLDPIAALLLAADNGDLVAEQELLDRYRSDEGLHPGSTIFQASPYGDPIITVDLSR